MRRSLLALVAALVGVGLFTGVVAWIFEDPRPAPGASRGERLYYTSCATCHGVDGSGSWRARLWLIRPGDLRDPRLREHSDEYLFNLIKHGGASIGRPGMPGFGYSLTDEDIRLLVQYVRQLNAGRASR